YPEEVKQLIYKAEKLTKQSLTYSYGSANPINKGMDCSGTINYLLKSAGATSVPRQANEIYLWAEKMGDLHTVKNQDFNSSEMKKLKPGDLLFWKGTYAVHRTPPITHVMIYLGKDDKGQPLMFGASNGRTYRHKKMWGVSVFDFRMSNGRGGDFVAYSCVPQLTC
ncbi:MAG: NlpC/P60 family protein, partial [Gammaproteobacteria bacterium]